MNIGSKATDDACLPPGDRAARTSTIARPGDGGIVFRLAYQPPFDWTTMARYLAARAIPGVESVVDLDGQPVYRRTVSLVSVGGPATGWLEVSQDGTSPDRERSRQSDGNQLTAHLSGSLAAEVAFATHRLRELCDLDKDPARIAGVLARDARLAGEVAAAPGLRMPGGWDRFELALRAVLGQQVTVAGASTLAGRMALRFGTAVLTPFAGLVRALPTAAMLAEASVSDIAAIGMPRARGAAVRALARFAAEGGLQNVPGRSCDDAVAMLDALPGIGPWTAHYIAMRALRYPDAFPAGDLGLRKAWAMLDGGDSLPTPAALERRAEAWRPWRAYAAATLWHALSRHKTPPIRARTPP